MRADGDHQKFATTVMPFIAEAFGIARWIAGNRADAEDILQEASLRAFRAISSCRGENARAWFLTIVRNTAHTWLARNRNFKIVATDDLSADDLNTMELGGAVAEVAPQTPEAELIARADVADVENAIAALPHLFREVVVMRDLQGLSYGEIATITGAAIGTVMSRLARGRRRLIDKLGRKAEE